MVKKVWSKHETKAFIARYKENPILWNPKIKDYRNQAKRRKIENYLSAEFNTTVFEIGRKIRILRTQWLKEYKKFKYFALNGKEYQSNWIWFKALKAVFGLNRDIEISDGNSIDDEQGDEEIYINITEDLISTEESSVVNFTNEEYKSYEKQTMTNNDEYQKFGDYVAYQLRSMHYRNNIKELKSTIEQSITKWQKKDNKEYYST
ncbi:uncharacterized protein LOC128198346 [Bicyclus anynana]|uniref:Uncharacterized protein LOC128198346 n=1 Tax=Bicyclus anynana TaxID=110368 RepID=A0ABM3LJM4_BICAN|nr:uncharacterized protein LOC128198346 [Bicyclus anynana]